MRFGVLGFSGARTVRPIRARETIAPPRRRANWLWSSCAFLFSRIFAVVLSLAQHQGWNETVAMCPANWTCFLPGFLIAPLPDLMARSSARA